MFLTKKKISFWLKKQFCHVSLRLKKKKLKCAAQTLLLLYNWTMKNDAENEGDRNRSIVATHAETLSQMWKKQDIKLPIDQVEISYREDEQTQVTCITYRLKNGENKEGESAKRPLVLLTGIGNTNEGMFPLQIPALLEAGAPEIHAIRYPRTPETWNVREIVESLARFFPNQEIDIAGLSIGADLIAEWAGLQVSGAISPNTHIRKTLFMSPSFLGEADIYNVTGRSIVLPPRVRQTLMLFNNFVSISGGFNALQLEELYRQFTYPTNELMRPIESATIVWAEKEMRWMTPEFREMTRQNVSNIARTVEVLPINLPGGHGQPKKDSTWKGYANVMVDWYTAS